MPLDQLVSKVSPTSQLVLRGNVSATGATRLSWSVWRNSSSGFVADVDLMEAGELIAAARASRADAENLIIRPGFLLFDAVYRVRLTAVLIGTDVGAQSELTFATNVPPRNGIVIVTPSEGTALVDTFEIAAVGFQDDDTPLVYRFGYERRASVRTWLVGNASSNATSALLPQGDASAGFSYQVVAEAADTYGATSTEFATVTVMRFDKEAFCTWSLTVEDMLNATDGGKTVELLTGIAVTLNGLNTTGLSTSAESALLADLSQTRQTMVEALNASVALRVSNGSSLAEGAVRQLSSTLEAVTIATEQLSPDAISASAHVLSTIASGDSAPTLLGRSAASSICSVASNLLTALVPPEDGATTGQEHLATAQQVSRWAREAVQHRFGQATLQAHGRSIFLSQKTGTEFEIVEVLSSVADAAAASLVPGEEPVSVETAAFAMQVEQLSTRSMATADRVSVGGGLAELPAAAFPDTDVQVQVIDWARNPFEPSVSQQPVGHSEMSMSSRVVTINVRSAKSGKRVANLSQPIRVNLTLLPSVRTCTRTCDTRSSDETEAIVTNRSNCIAPSEPSCSYLDTRAKEWRLDGAVVNRTGSSIVCEFSHLTDFAVCLGPPPRANAVASLEETFDLAAFASDNAAGLVMCLMLLVIVVVAGVRSARRHLRRIADEGRGIDDTASQLPYARGLRLLRDVSSGGVEAMRLRLRIKWTCGSLMFPIEGDPMDATQRQFVVVSTAMCAMAVNLLFFRMSDHTKHMCEGPAGSNCTEALRESGMCLCRTFDCGGCDGCAACRSLLGCIKACEEWRSNGLLAVIVSSCIVGPVVFSLNWLFKWLHKPELEAMAGGSASGPASGVSVRQEINPTTAATKPTGQRRSATSASLPYTYAAMASLTSIVLIASVSRRLSSAQTLEWLSLSAASLLLKWTVLDPLKVLTLAQLQRLAAADRRATRCVACLTALCTGSTQPPRLREAVQLVMRMRAGLDSLHSETLRAHVKAARERKKAEQAADHDKAMQEAETDERRGQLASMQQAEKEELEAHLQRVETTMRAMLAGQRDPFDCVQSIASIDQALDADAAHTVMRNYLEEAHRLAASRTRDHEESLMVDPTPSCIAVTTTTDRRCCCLSDLRRDGRPSARGASRRSRWRTCCKRGGRSWRSTWRAWTRCCAKTRCATLIANQHGICHHESTFDCCSGPAWRGGRGRANRDQHAGAS